ncbi:MAG: hypothetical protein ABEH43_04555, partial [Flavobacteriales bacterium]
QIQPNWDVMAGLVGGYGFSKHSAEQKIEHDQKRNLKNEYSNKDFGGILGMEYEVNIKKQWSIHLGIQGASSFKNIYEGTKRIPSRFNDTRIVKLGGEFGIRYHFSDSTFNNPLFLLVISFLILYRYF